MANHPSAVKRHRQSQKRRSNNQVNRHKLKTQLKKMRAAIATGKQADAKTALPATFGVIDRSVQKGVIKKNTAGRYKARLTKRVNITEDVPKFAAEQKISEEQALQLGLQQKAKEFAEKGPEIYAKV